MKTNKKIKILILNGSSRQCLPIAKGFRKNNCHVSTLCHSKLDVGYITKYANKKILRKCAKDDYDKQNIYINDLIKTNEFDIVIPLNDFTAKFLSLNKKEYSKYATIIVEDWEKFSLFIDKYETMQLCMRNNIGCPKTIVSNDVEEIEKEIGYPLVAKPRTACGSIGFNIIYNREQMGKYLVINKGITKFLIQEYVKQDGPQYGVEIFRNKNGLFSFCLVYEKPRFFPLDGGTATVTISIKNDEIANMSKQLLNLANWVGYANIDVLYDCEKKKYEIIEVNPRISAVVKLTEACGIDSTKIILENEFSNQITLYETYKLNKGTSCILTDILWLVKIKGHRKEKRRWFNRFNLKDVIFSFSDPLPFISFCIQSLKSYKKEMNKRKRN